MLSCDIGLLFLCVVVKTEDLISERLCRKSHDRNVLRSSTSHILQGDLLLILFNLLSHSVEDPIN